MRKLLLLLITLITLFACNSEDVVSPQYEGLQVNADFLRLSDNNNTTAGSLVIHAGVPEVTIKWNTGNLCNLDTTQTTLKLSKGTATLPIRWMGKLEAGTYGPEGVAFKAGVQITAGDKSQYIPLVWADKIDSTEILKSAMQSRAAGDIMPRVAQISMIPTIVNMNDVNGGSMYVGLNGLPFAILDASEITSDLNIDMSKIPNYITTSQILDFKWTSAGAPKFGFSVHILATSEGISQPGTINYSKGGGEKPTIGIECGGLIWAPGNLQYAKGVYSFMDRQDRFTGKNDNDWNPVVNPDYFAFNSLTPSGASLNNGDPCTKVLPIGTWRTPTVEEFEAITTLPRVLAYTDRTVFGYYYGVSSAPSVADQEKILFLPFPGTVRKSTSQFTMNNSIGYYWSSTFSASIGKPILFVSGIVPQPMIIANSSDALYSVRCVRNP